MKRFILLLLANLVAFSLFAQSSKKMDVSLCREILGMLPAKLRTQTANTAKDRVLDAKGKQGVSIRRQYGTAGNLIHFRLINQSLSLGIVSAAIAAAEKNSTPQNQVVVIDGYKALVQHVTSEGNQGGYEVVVLLSNNLISLHGRGYSRDDMIEMAKEIPLAQIEKKLQ